MSTFLRQDSSIPSTRNELGTQAHVAGQMLRRPFPPKSDWLYPGLGGWWEGGSGEWPLTQEVGMERDSPSVPRQRFKIQTKKGMGLK